MNADTNGYNKMEGRNGGGERVKVSGNERDKGGTPT